MKRLFVETDRLKIRNLQDTDLEPFLAYRSDPDITRYQGFDIMREADAIKFIRDQKNKSFGIPGEWVQYAIELITEKVLIGDCAVKLQENDPRIAEIGITLSGTYHKKGYAREALKGLIRFLFEDNRIHRIVETVDVRNTASIRLLESLFFRKEGHFIENFFLKGEWCSEFQYAMLLSEWTTIQASANFASIQ